MLTYAIIPARSGSKGVPNKNIRKIAGKPLIGYSIDFAKSLKDINRIICSTDCEQYAELAVSLGAEVPFLRSKAAATDTAMEEDVLKDLHDCFERTNIQLPDLLVWLRPTYLFRDRHKVKRCINRMKEDTELSACRLVCEAEGRLYLAEDDQLKPAFDDRGHSMVRRQDLGVRYRVYNTDVFRFPKNKEEIGYDFLGRKIGYEVANKVCAFDIDDTWDFDFIESILLHNSNMISQYITSI